MRSESGHVNGVVVTRVPPASHVSVRRLGVAVAALLAALGLAPSALAQGAGGTATIAGKRGRAMLLESDALEREVALKLPLASQQIDARGRARFRDGGPSGGVVRDPDRPYTGRTAPLERTPSYRAT